MKAAVCYDFSKPLVVEEVRLEPPQKGEVRVQIKACAICHSDIHYVRGAWGGQLPMVVGHEAAGIVTELGPGVERAAVGDHVVVTLIRSCGRCFYCLAGRPYNCEGDFAIGVESRLFNSSGIPLTHGMKTATFAEFSVVDQSQVVKIPDSLPFEEAALLGCGVITGFGAVANTAQVETGSRVVVIGCGGVGLNAIQGAAVSGASQVIAVDLVDDKLEAAHQFGATHAINPRKTDLKERVLALTAGRGADYAFVAVGSSKAIEQANTLIRPGGMAVIVGMPANEDALVPINAHAMTTGRTLTGSNMGSTRPANDIPYLVELHRQGRLKLGELISGQFPLQQINEAMVEVEAGRVLRNVIVF